MRGFASLLMLLLASCASGGKPKRDYASMRWEQRMNRQMKDPHSISSPFQKEIFHASRSVKTETFHAGEFHGKQAFSGGDDKFHTGTFAQSGQTSSAADQEFSGAADQNRMGGSLFRVPQNRFGSQTSSSAGKTSPMGNDAFRTTANPTGLKAAANSKRPLIQDTGTPSYGEDEVRKLLKKD